MCLIEIQFNKFVIVKNLFKKLFFLNVCILAQSRQFLIYLFYIIFKKFQKLLRYVQH